MNRNRSTSKQNEQIADEAGEWLVQHRCGSLDEAGKREFDAWVRTSPEHIRVYLELSAIWEDVSSVDLRDLADADHLVAHARAEPTVVPMQPRDRQAPPTSSLPSASPARSTSRVAPTLSVSREPQRVRRLAIAASLVAGLGLALASFWFQYSHSGTFETTLGELRSIVLDDGSTVQLNSQSRIRVRFAEHERDVELLAGQALFQVSKDKTRPFIVSSGETRVRAVGTQFDVYRRKGGTTVTVLEGQVAITSNEVAEEAHGVGDVPPSLLSAGEQITVTPRVAPSPTRANVATATAWTQRHLVFESATLADVAEEFNRYNRRPLVVEDARLRDFHVSGVFSSADPTLLLRFLRAQPEIAIEETDTEIRVTRR
ncbi:MAG: FecR domain-containing protein [Gammaproteobacteria bacterium]